MLFVGAADLTSILSGSRLSDMHAHDQGIVYELYAANRQVISVQPAA
jgi:hypothetical protein